MPDLRPASGRTFDLAELLLRRWFPERTDRESAVIKDFLLERGREFDRYEFSVHVGNGTRPDPEHLPGIQKTTVFSSQKRIDMLAWKGAGVTLFEVKARIGIAVLGQLQAYAQLLLEARPGILIERLAAIGRSSDDDTLRVLASNGIDVYLYPDEPIVE